jgi:hypothetical protein
MSGPGVTASGTGEFDDRSESARFSFDFEGKGKSLHMDAVVVGRAFYMKSPIFHSDPTFPDDKDWAKIDMKAAAKAQGIDFESLSPSSEFDFLRGSNGKPHKVGAQRIRGVETTHYKATIDLEAVARKASGKAREMTRKMIKLSGTKTIPYEVWVDKKGLVRKMAYSQHFGPDSPEFTITMTLYDFGAPVSIEAPPSDKVLDATKLLEQ